MLVANEESIRSFIDNPALQEAAVAIDRMVTTALNECEGSAFSDVISRFACAIMGVLVSVDAGVTAEELNRICDTAIATAKAQMAREDAMLWGLGGSDC